MTVIIEACDGMDLLKKIPDSNIDILLLDIQMPKMDGIETCKQIRKKFPEILILILSQLTGNGSIQKVMKVGAHGYFTKNTSPKQIETAINNLHEKGFYFEKDIRSGIKEILNTNKNFYLNKSNCHITNREMEVIKLTLKELTGKEIANVLSISRRTVEVHKKNLMYKTNSKNFIGVIIYAIANHYIPFSELE